LDYNSTENWILDRVPFYQTKGRDAYKPGLENVKKFITKLNLSLNQLKFIHVGGTNGKGSTCSYISSILQESNYKVGIFTSPHFFDFRERIKINNKKISKSFISKFVDQHKDLIEKLGLSFFELSFGLSLNYFYKEKVDYAIIEVGLGGRLDATNIINPLISVITNISYDHTEILGDTYEKIALEKAGIFKKNTKIIIGETNKKTDKIFIKKASEVLSPIHFILDNNEENVFSEIDYLNKNIKTAIKACRLLNPNNLSQNSINNGIERVNTNSSLIGRWTTIDDNPKVIFDAAHNEAGFISIANELSKIPYKDIYIMLGFVKGKNIRKLISHLPKESKLYFTSLNIERSMTMKDIESNLKGSIIFNQNPKKILSEIKKVACKDDLILITGSNFIAKKLFYEN